MNLCLPSTVSDPPSGQRPKLLMVTHRVPFPPDKGERIRSWNLLKALSRHYDVHLAALVDRALDYHEWQALRAQTVECVLVPISRFGQRFRAARAVIGGRSLTQAAFASRPLARTIEQWARRRRFDVVLAVCSSTAQYVRHLPAPRKVIDLVDVDSRKWVDYAQTSRGARRMLFNLESRRLARYERSLARDFDHILLTTGAEADLYRQLAPGAAVTVVPNGVDTGYFTPQVRPHRPVAVFTGVLDYRPNVEGLAWLIRHVWPAVRHEVPTAVLRIVGRDPSPAVHALAGAPGVELVGPVADVRPYLAEAAVAVAPLHIARGIQNKILEAMAMARPVVTTTGAAAPVAATNGRDLYAVDQPGEWACLMTRLLTHDHSARRVGAHARRFVCQHRQWSICTNAMLEVLGVGRNAPNLVVNSDDAPMIRAA